MFSVKNGAAEKYEAKLEVYFETTLRLVDIPVPDLSTTVKRSGRMMNRTEVADILTWLKESKGVAGIHELRVRDSVFLPHTEDTIRRCIAGFDIEVLDWKRINMSLQPLIGDDGAVLCPNLRRLTAYTNGWASLQYWTCEEVQRTLRRCFPKVRMISSWSMLQLRAMLTDLLSWTVSSSLSWK